jgi:hypothetical protein
VDLGSSRENSSVNEAKDQDKPEASRICAVQELPISAVLTLKSSSVDKQIQRQPGKTDDEDR